MELLRVVAESLLYEVLNPMHCRHHQWNQRSFTEHEGFAALIYNCFECSSDTKRAGSPALTVSRVLLTPLPSQQCKVVKENLLKTPALYFQIATFWHTGRPVLLSVMQREGSKCFQEEGGCNVIKVYEVSIRIPCS